MAPKTVSSIAATTLPRSICEFFVGTTWHHMAHRCHDAATCSFLTSNMERVKSLICIIRAICAMCANKKHLHSMLMSNAAQKIDELRQMEAKKADLWLDVFREQFTAIADELREIKAEQDSTNAMNDQFLKKDQLAEKLQVSISTVSKMLTEGLPSVNCGTAIRFDFQEVKEWLKSRRNNRSGKAPVERVSIPVRTQSSSNGKSQMEAQNGSI